MLKRVLIFWVGMLLLGLSPLAAQTMEAAMQAYDNEEYDKAAQALKDYLATEPKDDEVALYWLGMTYYQRDAYAKAKEYFQKGLDSKSRSPLNNAGMGLMMMIEEQYAEAYDYLQEAMDRSRGKDADVAYAVASAYLQGGSAEIQEAKKILYSRREEDPDDPRTYIMLGEYYKAQGVPELAIEELEKAITKKDDYVPAYVGLADLYYEKGKESGQGEDFKKAFDYANQAIELDSDFAPAYRTRAEIYLLMKNFDKARDDMQKYVSLTDGDLRAELRYASFLFLSKEYEAAVDQLQSIDTVTNVKRRLLGLSYYELGQLDEAQAAMDDYFDNVKKEEYIIWQDYQAYGDIMRTKGNLEKADEYYEKMIMKDGTQAAYFETLAEEYHQEAAQVRAKSNEMRKEAIAAQKKAKELTDQYNEYARASEVEKANAVRAQLDSVTEAGRTIVQERSAYMDAHPTEPIYALEAHYRQKVIDYAEAQSLQDYYKLAKALYFSDQYREADTAFKEVSKLSDTFVSPYQYRIYIANKLEDEDTTSNDWYAKPLAEDIIAVWDDKALAELDDKETKLLITAYQIMANYSFNPTGGEDPEAYEPEAAIPYVEKLLAIDPDYGPIKPLKDYIEQVTGKTIGATER